MRSFALFSMGAVCAFLVNGAFAQGAGAAALQQAMQRYPVELLTAPKCAPCADGRALLVARGVPFKEFTVTSAEDQRAMEAKGITSLPHLTIGRQVLSGFNEVEWHQYLGAAGYPEKSALPAGYRQAAAEPLAPSVSSAPAEQGSPVPAQGVTDVTPPALDPSNPAGIRF